MNSDNSMSSSDDELMDDLHVAIGNANAVAVELDSTISAPCTGWRRGGSDGLAIEDLSCDDALSFFLFRKVHLQEIADKLWPRLSGSLNGSKEKITFGKDKYAAPYDSLLLFGSVSIVKTKATSP
jgi:hypothetical protein